ncbi:hypothetical protein BCV71DRAFT_263417 [Rhizopus microsporus]|uniref:Uncharacterized protein n=1 Tax=Rhizopus microsporus TaxID=58291 RepID=A0A1X0S3N6_RHIZD|nr:hypothetical protein BCV71DRAFT_263417 [Rhizopus microsporus]
MVWGAIAGGKKSKLVFMKKGMGTSADFINQVYEPVLLDFYKCLDSPVFMEDDAPKLHYSLKDVVRALCAIICWPDEHERFDMLKEFCDGISYKVNSEGLDLKECYIKTKKSGVTLLQYKDDEGVRICKTRWS